MHIPEGAKGLVYGDDGPLTEADATSLFATSTQMAFKPTPGVTPETSSVADVLFPTLRDTRDARLISIARAAEIGAGIELEKSQCLLSSFPPTF